MTLKFLLDPEGNVVGEQLVLSLEAHMDASASGLFLHKIGLHYTLRLQYVVDATNASPCCHVVLIRHHLSDVLHNWAPVPEVLAPIVHD